MISDIENQPFQAMYMRLLKLVLHQVNLFKRYEAKTFQAKIQQGDWFVTKRTFLLDNQVPSILFSLPLARTNSRGEKRQTFPFRGNFSHISLLSMVHQIVFIHAPQIGVITDGINKNLYSKIIRYFSSPTVFPRKICNFSPTGWARLPRQGAVPPPSSPPLALPLICNLFEFQRRKVESCVRQCGITIDKQFVMFSAHTHWLSIKYQSEQQTCILYLKIYSQKQSTLDSSTRVGSHEGRRIKTIYKA